ncbi:MAG: hypothetical protein IJ642_05065 [Oscillospiraceae bacterium]|nr:hypothetical protein [Oscillospiraceae bacterium]
MKSKKHLQFLGMLAAGTASCMLFSGAAIASAAEADYHRASDYIIYDNSGNPYCSAAHQTGKFSVQPDYAVGDIQQDGAVNATDASNILIASALSGAGDTAQHILTMLGSCNTEEQALLFADIDNDGHINAIDAAYIMNYAASMGSGEEVLPLGSAYYYADQNGILQKGFIQDGNAIYYADEDYTLVSGWRTISGKLYYFNTEAVCTPETWLTLEGNTYYVQKDGSMAVDQQTVANTAYYFDTDGKLLSGWKEIGSQKYFYNSYGEKALGWFSVSGSMYYFDSETGAMQTGWLTLGNQTYYLGTDGARKYGQQMIDGTEYQFDSETGALITETIEVTEIQETEEPTEAVQTGWVTENGKRYYYNESGQKSTGWLMVDGKTYYMSTTTGEALSGWQELSEKSFTVSLPEDWKPDYSGIDNWTDEDWQKYYAYMGWNSDGEPVSSTDTAKTETKYFYYFSPSDFTMQTGWLTLPEGKYYLNEDGTRLTGSLEYNGNRYGFDENGLMITNQKTEAGSYDENGIYTPTITRDFDIDPEIRAILDTAELNPGIRHIDVKNRQNGLPYTTDPDLKNGITLTDRDYEIIEQFAAEHFTPDMTLSERLYVTWWWIHCNVDYAYNYTSAVWSLSYPDAVFNHKMGQCVQYNGAMAAVLAYYGFDVYMVKGWTHPETKSSQHYWTEVIINGKRYYVETGNQGKNGDHWQYFFEDAENVSYTKST